MLLTLVDRLVNVMIDICKKQSWGGVCGEGGGEKKTGGWEGRKRGGGMGKGGGGKWEVGREKKEKERGRKF